MLSQLHYNEIAESLKNPNVVNMIIVMNKHQLKALSSIQIVNPISDEQVADRTFSLNPF